jgi:hypothetical protein
MSSFHKSGHCFSVGWLTVEKCLKCKKVSFLSHEFDLFHFHHYLTIKFYVYFSHLILFIIRSIELGNLCDL